MGLPAVSSGDAHVAAHNAERVEMDRIDDEVVKRIPLPSGAQTGDLLRFDGVNWLSTETRFYEGNGRPDGVIAAPVGSRYVDKTGANGAAEWVKRSGGTGNTGWLCLAGDTGPRNIISLIDKGNGTLYSAILVRVQQIIELHIDITMPSNKTGTYTLGTLPVGFRPQYDRYGGLTDNKEGADTGGTCITKDGRILIYNVVGGKRDRYSGNWVTADAWPTSLPGVVI